jgi:hypothetical protein
MTTFLRLAYVTAHAAAAVSQRAVRVGVPVARVVMETGRLPARVRLHPVTEALAHRARGELATLTSDVERLIAAITVKLVDDLLNQLDLTAIIGDRVDLDALVATVNVSRVVDRVDVDTIVERVDVNALARSIDIDAITDRIDLGAIIARIDPNEIADRIDLGAIIARIDPNEIADRIDLGAIIARIDPNEIADRIDLGAIIARIDPNEIADRIDLRAVIARIDVDAIVATVNLDAVVDRIDVLGIAEHVINEIDLPEIIRDSTGSMASQVVRGARMQSIDADEAVSRLVDRVLRRQPSGPPRPGAVDGSRR